MDHRDRLIAVLPERLTRFTSRSVARWLLTQEDRGETVPGTDLELLIPSERVWVRAALDLAASVARSMRFPADRVDDLRSAIHEAIANAIEHGNAALPEERIQIVLVPRPAGLRIDVHDHSRTPFPEDIETAAPPSIEDRLAGLTPSRGWGTFLMRSLVDEVAFSSTGEGNVVQLTMHLHPVRSRDSAPAEAPIDR